ncbi:hypothetical protein ACI2KR_08025 [Pseudomonas luteola]
MKLFLPKSLLALFIGTVCVHAQADVYRIAFQLSTTIPSESGPNASDKAFTEWLDVGTPYNCSWSPLPSQVGSGITFTQSASDCLQKQSRTNGTKKEDRVITIAAEQQNVGILENWKDGQTLYGDWIMIKPAYGCQEWMPEPSSYKETMVLTQSSTSCLVDESREGQKTEQEGYSGRTRNLGEPFIEQRTLTEQQASRSYQISYTDWKNTDDEPVCAAWSPDPSLVPLGESFEQNGTNCTIKQLRTRSESYTDHNSGSNIQVSSVTETRELTGQSTSRTYKGTGNFDTTPYNLTDGNWVNGVARRWAGFFVANTEANRAAYTVGRYVKYANGQVEKIGSANQNGKYLNLYTSGSALDGTVVGYPHKITIVP